MWFYGTESRSTKDCQVGEADRRYKNSPLRHSLPLSPQPYPLDRGRLINGPSCWQYLDVCTIMVCNMAIASSRFRIDGLNRLNRLRAPIPVRKLQIPSNSLMHLNYVKKDKKVIRFYRISLLIIQHIQQYVYILQIILYICHRF